MTPTIRKAAVGDAIVTGTICYNAFRKISGEHNFPPDFSSPEVAIGLTTQLLAHPRIFAVVAELDGQVVGSNFLWEQCAIAGVGPITVDPSVQNSQVGRSLMRAVLDRVDQTNRPGVRLLQAAYHNRSLSLYTKLGFDTREAISTVQGPPIQRSVPGYAVRKATTGDIHACNALCLRVHGHDRNGDLTDAVQQGTATVVEHAGRITGYATLLGYFGHAVAESNNDLKALIAAAPDFAGPGMLVPTRNGDLLRWCLQNGLRVIQPMTLMSRGLYNEPSGVYLPSILF